MQCVRFTPATAPANRQLTASVKWNPILAEEAFRASILGHVVQVTGRAPACMGHLQRRQRSASPWRTATGTTTFSSRMAAMDAAAKRSSRPSSGTRSVT
jgi:hypothetical protein